MFLRDNTRVGDEAEMLVYLKPVARLVKAASCVVNPWRIIPAMANMARRPLLCEIKIKDIRYETYDFFFGHFRGDLELEGVELEVAGGAAAGFLVDGDAREELDEADGEGRAHDGVGVLVEGVPEDIDLRLALGDGPSRERSEGLDEENAGDSHHRQAAVLELGLAHPVEVDADVVDVRETQGVEAPVASHRAV